MPSRVKSSTLQVPSRSSNSSRIGPSSERESVIVSPVSGWNENVMEACTVTSRRSASEPGTLATANDEAAPIRSVSTDRVTRLASKDAVLLDAEGDRVAAAGEVSSSLRSLPSGRAVEGIVTFPAQAAADGLTVRMTFRGPSGPTALEVPLQGLIHPLGIVSGSPSPIP